MDAPFIPKKMDIVIKNVTGDSDNLGALWELSRAGFPEGSIVKNTTYYDSNKSCHWSTRIDDCVAWLGQTCVELPKTPKRKKTKSLTPKI